MKSKRSLLMCLAVALSLTMALTGTLAYLSDTDSDVNVMVVGNVNIEQLELERADGIAYNAALTDGDLAAFSQGKPLYPAYAKTGDASYDLGEALTWGPYVTDADNAASQLYNDANLVGALDKFVFVENTGASSAYYRTLFAFEYPESADGKILINKNEDLAWETIGFTQIAGIRHQLMVATYPEALEPGDISVPSLLQVALHHTAGNAEVNDLGETYDILVLTQAVQTVNFEDLQPGAALDVAFGDVTVNNHPWKDLTSIPTMADSVDELLTGGDVMLNDDIDLGSDAAGTTITSDTNINLNGKTISATRPVPSSGVTAEAVSAMVIRGGVNVTIDGEGGVVNDDTEAGYAIAVYENSTLTIKDGRYISGHDALYVKEGELIIEGGFFQATKDTDPNLERDYSQHTNDYAECSRQTVINCQDDNYVEGRARVIVKGGTFVNFDPSNVHEGRLHHRNHVADGYKVVTEPQSNGDVWFTVVPE